MRMKARYASRCDECDRMISPGDMIVVDRLRPAIHEECGDSPDGGETSALREVNRGRDFLSRYDDMPSFYEINGYEPGDQ